MGEPTVLIADDEDDSRAQLAEFLESTGYEVWQAMRGDEALALAREKRPSIAILEIPLPVLSGYEVCRAIKSELHPHVHVLFLSGKRTEPYDRVAGLLIGADDYLTKPYAPDELLVRIRLLAPVGASLAASVESKLTPRETEVLGLLTQGLRQQEIAEQLTISPRTVGTHIEHILRKLGVNSRAQAIAVAYQNGDGVGASPLHSI
jgi:DNA-binding NarL/FixJ family response regulator